MNFEAARYELPLRQPLQLGSERVQARSGWLVRRGTAVGDACPLPTFSSDSLCELDAAIAGGAAAASLEWALHALQLGGPATVRTAGLWTAPDDDAAPTHSCMKLKVGRRPIAEELDAIASILSQTEKASYYAFTLADTTSGPAQLRSGQSVQDATTRVCEAGGDGVFFNCSVPEVMANAVTEAKQVLDELGCSIEIGVYANNFTPIGNEHEANDTIQAMRELTPQDYLEYSKAWFESGATIIGGCCGIGPEHIKALSEWQSTLKS